jgi:hypothetical protein
MVRAADVREPSAWNWDKISGRRPPSLPERRTPLRGRRLSQNVSADPITVNFDVNVTFALGSFEEIFGVPIGVGDLLSGHFTYDPGAPDSNPLPNFGIYPASGQSLHVDWGTGLTVPIQACSVSDNTRCAPPLRECDAFGAATVPPADPEIPGFEFWSLPTSRRPLLRALGDPEREYQSRIAPIRSVCPCDSRGDGGISCRC